MIFVIYKCVQNLMASYSCLFFAFFDPFFGPSLILFFALVWFFALFYALEDLCDRAVS